MAEGSSYLLDHASIFIAANTHVPLLLEPGNLVENGIIPSDWENEDSLLSMVESHVHYSNGIRLKMDLQSFQIVDPGEDYLQDSYLIHGVADAFLEKYPHISYQNVGLNYLVGFLCNDPQQWLIDRFEPSYLRSGGAGVFSMMPIISFDMGEELKAICRLNLNVGSVKRDGEDKNIVTINVNIDHSAPLNAAGIREAVGLWKEKQDFLISKLDKIFGDIKDV